MGQFKVYNSFPEEFTFISNSFLDFYMPSANGEFVKIYLYLLRHASGKGTLIVQRQIFRELSATGKTAVCWTLFLTETEI